MKYFIIFLMSLMSLNVYAAETVKDYIDDSTIAAHIITKFIRSEDVSAFDLKTHVYKGEVEICGFVDNETQIRTALNLANSVEGVKKVHNGLSLRNMADSTASTDTLITSKVKASLIASKNIPSSQISVLTDNGRVQLCGFVASQNTIPEVERIAKQVNDVKSVENKLVKMP